jgi:hypothetical protein
MVNSVKRDAKWFSLMDGWRLFYAT